MHIEITIALSPEFQAALDRLAAACAAPDPPPQPAPTPRPKTPPPAPSGRFGISPAPYKTERRRAELVRLRTAQTPWPPLLAALNALPGPAIPNAKALENWWQKIRHQPSSPAPSSSPARPWTAGSEPPLVETANAPAEGPGRAAGTSAPEEPRAPPAPPSLAAAARTPLARIPADREQIVSFLAGRGMVFDPFDIDAINARLARLGHGGFELIDRRRIIKAA